MRVSYTALLSLFAALAAAQTTLGPNAFSIPENQSTYTVAAGGSVDLSWTNQQGSTVTIKLQIPGYTSTDSGITLASSIPNTGSTTVQIPDSADIPAGAYTFEIIDDSNTSQYNFSPQFSVSGASGTAGFGTSATASGTSASASASAVVSSASSAASASATSSSASASRSSASASSVSASATQSSAAATSSAAAQTTTAPNSNAGAKVQAPLAAAILIGAAAFL